MFRPLYRIASSVHLKALRMCSTSALSRRLDGKVAVVTASTEGIGLSIAQQLGRDGAKIVVSSRKQDNVIKATAALEKEGIDVLGIMCHVGKSEHRKNLVQRTLSHFGGIDILVSNAAANPVFGSILQTSEEAWDKIFEVNVKSSFLLAKEMVPHMEKRGGGSIVFISSIGGYHPLQGLGAYCVSKTALFGLTKVLATECADFGVRVNCVAPGIIKTRFSAALWKNEAMHEEVAKQIPLKRLGKSEEVGGTVSFLCSDQASYLTGETIVIGGGMTSRL
ncbi:dehydrogenase/reductase SDR family member 4-like [Actinia tenebrosa]|uniref:Dehydrogenase/reductase SDR family member 4-like n=1 Tax=Actinia tenebrosa TaxID=6105 RepID=A0A6P8I9N7_ACTTE|nr:dehydrogenase/reductase SDR family member 4-like [Actinia tenebrosa]